MARPIGATSHWWKTRKVVAVYLYNPTDEDIKKIRALAKEINDNTKRKFYGE